MSLLGGWVRGQRISERERGGWRVELELFVGSG